MKGKNESHKKEEFALVRLFWGATNIESEGKKSSLTCDSAFLLALGRGDGIYRNWLLNNAQNYYFTKKYCSALFIGCFGS